MQKCLLSLGRAALCLLLSGCFLSQGQAGWGSLCHGKLWLPKESVFQSWLCCGCSGQFLGSHAIHRNNSRGCLVSGGPQCWPCLEGCSAHQRPLQDLLSLVTSSAHQKCFCRETAFTISSVSEGNNLKPYLPFLCWCLSGCVQPLLPHAFTALAKHSEFLVHFPLFPLYKKK